MARTTIATNLLGRCLAIADSPMTAPGYAKFAGLVGEIVAVRTEDGLPIATVVWHDLGTSADILFTGKAYVVVHEDPRRALDLAAEAARLGRLQTKLLVFAPREEPRRGIGIPYAVVLETELDYRQDPGSPVGRDILLETVQCPYCEERPVNERELDEHQEPGDVIHYAYLEHLKAAHPEKVSG